jgi:hypothetical protein
MQIPTSLSIGESPALTVLILIKTKELPFEKAGHPEQS